MMVSLGVIAFVEELSLAQRMMSKANLKNSGLELPKVNYCKFISEKLDYIYAYLANISLR
jgi:hypothetical protein